MLLSKVVYLLLCVYSAVAVDPLVDVVYSQYLGATIPAGITQWLGIRYAAPPLGDLRFRAPADPLVNDTVQAADQVRRWHLQKHQLIIVAWPYMPPDQPNEPYKHYLGGLPLPGRICADQCNASQPTPRLRLHSRRRFQPERQPELQRYRPDTGFANEYRDCDLQLPRRTLWLLDKSGGRRQRGPECWSAGSAKGLRVGPAVYIQGREAPTVQQAANRAKFGGDPDHVTIGGDSAGGASVDLHLSAYSGRDDGLFHAAAAESQSFGAQFTVPQAQYQYDALVQRTGCNGTSDTLQCLRSLPIEVLQGNNINIAAPGGVGAPLYMYSNVIDGDFTPDYTYNMYAQGRFLKIPVIFG